MKASYALSHSVVPAGVESTLDVLINFESSEEKAPRRPLNLSLVLDRSGSMGGTPLKQAIRASKLLVDGLNEEDRLSIVTYDDHIRTVLKPQLVKDKAAIKAILDKVRAGGITNLSGGWLEGCKHTAGGVERGGVNRVMLLTDGQANMGVTNKAALVKIAKEQAEKGIVTTTLGFGSYFNEDILIGIADAAGGNFYFIQSPHDAAEVFKIEVEGLASMVAEDLAVSIEPAAGVSGLKVLNNYPTKDHGGVLTVQVGDVYAIEPKPLSLELKVSPAGSDKEAPLASMSYGYKAEVEGELKALEGELSLAAPVGDAGAAEKNREVIVQAARLTIGAIKLEAVALADKGDLSGAAAKLRGVIDDFKARELDESFEIAEELDQLDHFARLFERRQYNTGLRKEILDQSYQARRRGRGDLKLRGLSSGSTADLDAVTAKEGEEGEGVVVVCKKEGGKLRVHAVSEGYDKGLNVQFPRAIRQEGARYLVEELAPSKDGSFYRAKGAIKLLLRPGESRPAAGGAKSKGALKKVAVKSWSDVPTTDEVGDGVLIQIVKDKSKLRARVVSDGYDPDKNMRFPRSIRKEGVLFVVEDVKPSGDDKFYIAYGKILRLVQDEDEK